MLVMPCGAKRSRRRYGVFLTAGLQGLTVKRRSFFKKDREEVKSNGEGLFVQMW